MTLDFISAWHPPREVTQPQYNLVGLPKSLLFLVDGE